MKIIIVKKNKILNNFSTNFQKKDRKIPRQKNIKINKVIKTVKTQKISYKKK